MMLILLSINSGGTKKKTAATRGCLLESKHCYSTCEVYNFVLVRPYWPVLKFEGEKQVAINSGERVILS